MRDVRLSYTDHELFGTMFSSDEYHYIISHLDALKRMWNEQGKSFWLKFLVMYRQYCYTTGSVYSMKKDKMTASIPLCIHRICILSDQLFVVLHNEFVHCRYSAAKQFIDDLAMVMSNRGSLFACKSSSISNNPFYNSETRDSFRKLLGHCKNFPSGLKEFYYMGLGYPILGIFGGGIYHLLRKWLQAPSINVSPEEYLKSLCWVPPPEYLDSQAFVPTAFHRHLLDKHSVEIDSLLYEGSFGMFSSWRMVQGELLQSNNYKGEPKKSDCDCDCKNSEGNSTYTVYESFVEFICQIKEFHPGDKYDPEELRWGFEDFLKEKVENFEDEEYRRSKILKLAEKKFQKELEEEKKLSAKGVSAKNKNFKAAETKWSKTEFTKDPITCSSKLECSCSVNESPLKGASKVADTTRTTTKENNVTIAARIPESKAVDAKKVSKSVGTGPDRQNAETQVCLPGTTSTEVPCKRLDSAKPNLNKQAVSTASIQISDNLMLTSVQGNKKSRKKTKKLTKEMLDNAQVKDTKNAVGKNSVIESGTTNSSRNLKESARSEHKNVMTKSTAEIKKESVATASKPVSRTEIPKNLSKQTANKVTNQNQKEKSKQNVSSELKTIGNNIDCIQQAVKETNSLSVDHFRLMVETGSLLMNGNKIPGNNLQTCTHCRKVEEKPKSFKKCARCKAENIKFVRFYCSRECQVENWSECHQDEHDNKLLPRKM